MEKFKDSITDTQIWPDKFQKETWDDQVVKS